MRRFLPLLLATVTALSVRVGVRADDLVLDRFGDYVEALRVQAGIPGLVGGIVGIVGNSAAGIVGNAVAGNNSNGSSNNSSSGIVGNTDLIWSRAFGKQDLDRSIATRIDTPFQLDGLTQIFTASLILRCVEEGKIGLDDRVGRYVADAAEPNATIRQLLTYTSADGTFKYKPERLAPLASVIAICAAEPFRTQLATRFRQLVMMDTVPGLDVVRLTPTKDGIFTTEILAGYRAVLERLATPYAVDAKGRSSASRAPLPTLTAASGVISTVWDLAQFVLDLRIGTVLRPETLALAWRPVFSPIGLRQPHGLGWFVQSYNGETIVWQFGVTENASSSLIVTVPSRGLSLILLANSDGLVKPFPLAAGDLTTSPFGRLFLGVFVR